MCVYMCERERERESGKSGHIGKRSLRGGRSSISLALFLKAIGSLES